MVDAALHELERRWHTEIPISATMGIHVHRFDGRVLETAVHLAPNLNVHGTAFAGSQFSAASLCGWGQVHLQLGRAGLSGSIVFVEGNIRCLAPVRADMLVRCAWPQTAAEALDALRSHDRCRIHLDVQIETEDGIAADFRGEYGVRLVR